jgi:hypothetical protein
MSCACEQGRERPRAIAMHGGEGWKGNEKLV